MDPAQQFHYLHDPNYEYTMPTNVEIEVFLIAKTEIQSFKLADWLESIGVNEEVVDMLLDTGNTDADILTACAAKQCYMSFQPGLNPNVTKTRDDMVEHIDNILKQGHGSVLEHVSFTFAINNVSRVLTGELNRHRAGAAISERSMRYIRFEQSIKWWLPTSLREDPNDNDDLAQRKAETRAIFDNAFAQMENNYRALVAIWDMDGKHKNFEYKKAMTSCFRRIIGMGAATGGVWTFNIRALRHILTMRCPKSAEEEIRLVASMMLEIMKNQEPVLFGDFDNNGVPKYNKV